MRKVVKNRELDTEADPREQPRSRDEEASRDEEDSRAGVQGVGSRLDDLATDQRYGEKARYHAVRRASP